MDDLGNTESPYFASEPAEQVQERKEEKAKVMKGIAMLEEIIERFEKRIAFYDTLNSIDVDASTHPEEHLRIVIANKQTSQNLTEEKEWIENLRDTYKR